MSRDVREVLLDAAGPPPERDLDYAAVRREWRHRRLRRRLVAALGCVGILLAGVVTIGNFADQRVELAPRSEPAPTDEQPEPGHLPSPDSCGLLKVAAEDVVPGPLAENRVIARAQVQRAGLGLPADPQLVTELHEDPQEHGAVEHHGLWITPAERDELEARGRLEPPHTVAGLARGYASAYEDEFGGVWFDDRLNLFVVAFTADVERHVSAIRLLVPHPPGVVGVQGTYSYAELEATSEAILAQTDDLSRHGVQLAAWGVHEPINRVEVGVEGLTEDAISELHRRFPPAHLCIREQPPLNRP